MGSVAWFFFGVMVGSTIMAGIVHWVVIKHGGSAMRKLIVALAVLVFPCVAQAQTLQALIDSTPDGATLDLTGQSFVQNQTIRIIDRTGLTIIGGEIVATTDGSELPPWNGKQANWPRHRSHLRIEASTGVTIDGLRIVSINSAGDYNSDLELQHGIHVTDGSLNTTLLSVEVDDVHGDCVTVAGDAAYTTVWGADCNNIGRQGMAITDATDTLIKGTTDLPCYMGKVARTVFDFEPLTATSQSVARTTIQGCTIAGPYGGTVFGHSGNGDIIDTYLLDNKITAAQGMKTKLGASAGCYAAGCVRSGIYFNGNIIYKPSQGHTPLSVNNAYGPLEIIGNTFAIPAPGVPAWSYNNVTDPVVISGNHTKVVAPGGGGK